MKVASQKIAPRFVALTVLLHGGSGFQGGAPGLVDSSARRPRVLRDLGAPLRRPAALVPPARRGLISTRGTPALAASSRPPDKKGGGMSADMKRRLTQEAETPWRTVRQFFYAGFGASATIGGLTALAQLAASAAHRADALPLTQSLTNVA
eukprot:CAMPEP_0185710264 /NCGR_PEP_ID=MMETSP1164-20130828/30340_1 /TAXON_ID=1104430 /ORGANISM="Chrysoreinhardia sp, Strain CCMP2950" /LENGTH=150 /DNA_ID=CAMNT_0028377771 /DNA_START=11 /DNA_END=459 /DNA_ORIENTATION=-